MGKRNNATDTERKHGRIKSVPVRLFKKMESGEHKGVLQF